MRKLQLNIKGVMCSDFWVVSLKTKRRCVGLWLEIFIARLIVY